jgi:hypothetical protein
MEDTNLTRPPLQLAKLLGQGKWGLSWALVLLPLPLQPPDRDAGTPEQDLPRDIADAPTGRARRPEWGLTLLLPSTELTDATLGRKISADHPLNEVSRGTDRRVSGILSYLWKSRFRLLRNQSGHRRP